MLFHACAGLLFLVGAIGTDASQACRLDRWFRLETIHSLVSGLSLLGTDDVPPIDAAHAMPASVMRKIEARNAERAQVRERRGGSQSTETQPLPLMSFVDSAFTTRAEYERWAAEMKAGGNE
eukprot:scaffold61460_cov34-Tisochrysis_lutea.AAC.4